MDKPIGFNDMRPEEKTLAVLRRHPIVLLKGALQILGIAILLIAIVLLVGFNSFVIIALIIGVLLAGFIGYYNWFIWFHDIYILTDQRLVDIEQKGLFTKSSYETSLDLIQDVTDQINGPVESLFRYGTVIVHTAGPVQNMTIDAVPNTAQIRHDISQAIDSYRKKAGIITGANVPVDGNPATNNPIKENTNEQNIG